MCVGGEGELEQEMVWQKAELDWELLNDLGLGKYHLGVIIFLWGTGTPISILFSSVISMSVGL